MFLNEQERLNPKLSHPFVNAVNGFDYLGIKITPKVSLLSSANYDPLTAKLSEDTTRWMTLPLSLMGRINVIKMNILPKFLYVFQSLPLPPPPNFFLRTRKLLSNFVEQQEAKTETFFVISALWKGWASITKFFLVLLGGSAEGCIVLVL